MTTRERLALMDDIKRKNDAEWNKFKRQPCYCAYALHPLAAWALKCLITFCVVILLGVVALMA